MSERLQIESHCSQNRENIIVVPMKSHIKIKLSNLGSRIPVTRDLKYDCSLVISKD